MFSGKILNCILLGCLLFDCYVHNPSNTSDLLVPKRRNAIFLLPTVMNFGLTVHFSYIKISKYFQKLISLRTLNYSHYLGRNREEIFKMLCQKCHHALCCCCKASF